MGGKDLEKSNRAKYGDKSNDVIAQAYMMDKLFGDVWCIFNAKKYIERYIRPNSTKGGNITDVVKARDYLDRMIKAHEGEEVNDTRNTEADG